MTTGTMNSNDVEAAARALLDERISAVRDLVATRRTCQDKRAELDEAERADAAAYTAAQRAGWTVDELRRLGLAEPDRRTPGRARRRTARATPAASQLAALAPTGPAEGPSQPDHGRGRS